MPEPIKLGDTGVRIVDVQRDFDPQYGATTTFIWEGEEEALNTMAPNMGGKSRVYRFTGPVFRMSVRYGDAQDGSTEIPTDTWEIDDDLVEAPIWECPKLIASIGGDDAMATLKGWILDSAAAKDTPSQFSVKHATFGDNITLYNEYFNRGTRAYEVKRPTIKRVRTISANYAAPVVIVVPEPIYSTQKLITAFGIPTKFAAQLPADPGAAATPSGRVWAWKQRKESSKYTPVLNKIEETMEWVFTPWSLLTHAYIS